MKVVDIIDKKYHVQMADVDEEYAPCLLDIHIRLTKFDNNKYEGHIIAKEDGWTKEAYHINNMGKRAVNNKLAIFGLCI